MLLSDSTRLIIKIAPRIMTHCRTSRNDARAQFNNSIESRRRFRAVNTSRHATEVLDLAEMKEEKSIDDFSIQEDKYREVHRSSESSDSSNCKVQLPASELPT